MVSTTNTQFKACSVEKLKLSKEQEKRKACILRVLPKHFKCEVMTRSKEKRLYFYIKSKYIRCAKWLLSVFH